MSRKKTLPGGFVTRAVIEWLEERRLLSSGPNIVHPASAVPNPVTGTNASLSVLGNDANGESSLTYTWGVINASAGAVTFSNNGTNAAKNTVATFVRTGDYDLDVVITDTNGLSVSSDVDVPVVQTATSVQATSTSTTVAAGETTQLTATEVDQFGNSLATQPTFTWSKTSGTGSVSASGLYTASTVSGSAIVKAAVTGGLSGSETLAVAAPLVWYQADATSGTTLADSSGNNQTATLVGSTLFLPGFTGNALSLQGGYASLPTGIVSTLHDFTIAAWVRIPTLSYDTDIFSFGNGNGDYMYLSPESVSGTLTFGISTSGQNAEQTVNGAILTPGAWAHVAVTLAGSNLTLCVNGVEVGSGIVSLTPSSLGNTTQNDLGVSHYTGGPALYASIDDFRIYGAALPTEQLRQIASVSLPADWTDSNIGAPGLSGGAFYVPSSGVWTVDGTGYYIGSTFDQLNLVSKILTGDLVLSGEETNVGSVSGYGETGLMIRTSLADDSVEAAVVMTPQNGVEFITRTSTGADAQFATWSPISGPVWMQLDRFGSDVMAYFSNDDLHWYELGSATDMPELGTQVLAGLASTSQSENIINESTFSNVSVNQATAPTIVNAAAASSTSFVGSTTNLSVAAADDSGQQFLTYSWAVSGSAPAPVIFSANDSNSANVTQATFTASGTYNLTVTATDVGGYFVQSTVAVTVSVPPSAPVGVAAYSNGSSISVSWQPAAGAVSYNVYRATLPGGEGSTAIGTGITSTHYGDSAVTTGRQYYYQITAVGAGGLQSGRSFEVGSLTSAFSGPIISQFVALNNVTLADSTGTYSDWLQLYNPTSATVNLAGDYLTNTISTLNKWQFPAATLAPGGFLTIFADSENQTDSTGTFHTNFNIPASGGYLALVAGNGATILSSYNFGQQVTDVAYGISMAQAEINGSVITSYGGVGFLNPAVNAINGTLLGTAITAEPTFSYPDGFYSTTILLTISSTTTGASIYYTTDGTAPSVTNGTLYNGAITINGESIIRAMAIAPEYLPSPASAATYIYLSQVITQASNGQAPAGWPVDFGYSVVHYGMDPNVVDNSLYSSEIIQDLLDLPSVSLSTSLQSLFDPEYGIYSESQSSNGVKIPGSVELINPSGAAGFQADVGISIKGDYSALEPNGNHGFDLHFGSQYGVSELDYPVFGADAAQSFKEIELRTDQNNSWSFSDPDNFLGVRDEMENALLAAVGQAAEHSKICFLYVNGMFWGLYDIIEKPDDDFAASYFGGSASGYDTIKATNVNDSLNAYFADEAIDGTLGAWDQLYTQMSTLNFSSNANFQLIQGNNPDGTRNPAYPDLLNIDNLIQYMLVNYYVGNIDAPYSTMVDAPNNFYALRPTDGSFGFEFVATDSEWTLLDPLQYSINLSPTTLPSATQATPAYFFEQLESNPEFKALLSNAVEKDFFNGGPLSVSGVTATFDGLVAQLEGPVVAESARWGDALRLGQPYTRDDDWQPLVSQMLSSYFPNRTATVILQLEGVGLFASTPTPPVFSQYGGTIAAGFQLRLSGSGSIYYTLDGSDPYNASNGGISSTAVLYTGPITLQTTSRVKAAVESGSAWSADVDETFYAPITGIRVTELNYDPTTPAGGAYSNSDDEFIELKNFGSATVDFDNATFSNGITYTFGNVTLAPGQVGVLVSNATAFEALYRNSPYILGSYQSGGTNFSNSEEEVTLVDATGSTVFDFTYSSAWYSTTAGGGPTLEVTNPAVNPNLNVSASWQPSPESGGTPGIDDSIPTGAPTGLTASFISGQVVLSWPAVAGAASYDVYRGTISGGEATTPIATGVTGNSFSDLTAAGGVTYFYTVSAANRGGVSSASNEASVVVPQTPTDPAMASQPVDELVLVGNTASFTATATGYPAPTIQWFVSAFNSSSWTLITGATSTTYRFMVPSTAVDGNRYQAVFTNSQGAIKSNAVTLTAIAGAITAWNFDTSDVTGKSIGIGTNFSPAPSTGSGSAGSIGMALYTGPDSSNITDDPGSSDGNSSTQQAWKIVGTNGWNSNAAIGTQGAQFFVTTVGYTSISLQFDWDVTAQGEGSLAVEYTLNSGASWLLAPALYTNGASGVTVKTNSTSGKTVQGEYFSAHNASGTEVWYNGLTADFNDVSGVEGNPDFGIRLVNASTSSDCVNLSGAALNNTSGNWRIDEVNVNGETPLTAPTITHQPASQAVTLGGTATFTAAATGNEAPTVQWEISTDGGDTWTPIPGATSTTCTISVTSLIQDTSQYEAVFTNSLGSVISTPASLTTVAAPISGWNFDTSDITGAGISTGTNTSPSPSTGSGTAASIGMELFTGPDTSNITDDPGSSDGISPTQQAWKLTGNNGWNSNAAVGTQGAQFFVSTLGYNSITLQFDWDVTAQGEGNLAVEYSTDGGATWLLAPSLNCNGDAGVSVKSNTTSADTVNGEYFSAYSSNGTEVWYNRLTADFSSVAGAADNPNFGVRLVNASTDTDCVNLSGAALNNTSGNWRIDEVDINGNTAATANWTGAADGVTWNLPGNWSDDLIPNQKTAVSISAGFNTIRIPAGSFFALSVTASSPIEFDAGSELTLNGASTFSDGLKLESGAKLLMNPISTLLVLSALNLNAGGVLDLTDNYMVIDNSALSPITGEIASGYKGGLWTGSGITSSTAAADPSLTAIGVILNDDGAGNPLYGSGGVLGLFDGYSPPIDSILVTYTYYGDATLNHKVDGSDYSLIDSAYATQRSTGKNISGWHNGDFNFDGVVNGTDYTLIDNAFNMQSATLSSKAYSSATTFTAAIASITPRSAESKTGKVVTTKTPTLTSRPFAAATSFQTKTPIRFYDGAGENVEALLLADDLIDRLSAAR